ncbi:peptidoglycan recognition protein-like [Leguminivora glycinivorella]|uniref:peptidoglycan recognition protein-like n=1 Tax=Leguminivora glycinivorella TaxID=1035111 RepID=UPI00200C5E72|nr:peptidoglycan recognition protein-like [Leguminivora glycinivorella]
MGSSSRQDHPDSGVAVSSIPPMELVVRTPPVVSTIMNISKKTSSKFTTMTETQNAEKAVPVKDNSFLLVLSNTSGAKKLSCACAAFSLVLCTALIIYFTHVVKRSEVKVVDRAPHDWNITREDWQARDRTVNITMARFAPLKLVLVQHTVGPECHSFITCAAVVRNLQIYYLDSKHLGYDIPYNFLVGNDGRVYEGRGWNIEGAHTFGYNRCSLGVAFIGDYSEELSIHSRVTELQLERFIILIEDGIGSGFLRPDYTILPAKDVRDTTSPGSNLYRALQNMNHYERTHSFRDLNCEAIYDKLGLPYHL